MLSTCVIGCNTREQKQVSRSKLKFQILKQTHSVHSHIPSLWNRKLSLLQTENNLPLTLCSHFCTLPIVKIEWKPVDAIEEARRYRKCRSHDGQLLHSNCKRIYAMYMTPNKNGKVIFATH